MSVGQLVQTGDVSTKERFSSNRVAKPTIIYGESLFDDDVPYTVSVDTEACGTLLSLSGASNDDTHRLHILAERKGPWFFNNRLIKAGGAYKETNGQYEVSVYLDSIWNNFYRYSRHFQKTPTRSLPPLKGVIASSHSPAVFLLNHTSTSHREWAEGDIDTALQVVANGILLHELGHFVNYTDTKIGFAMRCESAIAPAAWTAALFAQYAVTNNLLTTAAMALPTFLIAVNGYYRISPNEKLATRFARKHLAEVLKQPLITIKPKSQTVF